MRDPGASSSTCVNDMSEGYHINISRIPLRRPEEENRILVNAAASKRTIKVGNIRAASTSNAERM